MNPYNKSATKPGEHLWIIDKGDPRFKYCTFCGDVAYRTDEELLKAAQQKGIRKI